MSHQNTRPVLTEQSKQEESSAHVVLKVHATTWTRDSHDLFDYEARHVNTKRWMLSKQGKIFRNGVDVSVAPGEWYGFPASVDYLLSVREKDGRFIVISPEKNVGIPNQQVVPKKVWLIVKDLRHGKYPLGEGDVVKLGRFKLKVKKLVFSGEPSVPELRVDGLETPVTDISMEEAKAMQCRICLLEGGGDDDPLVCPCQCKGSIKYVHVDCLRHWINGRLNLTDDQRTSFFFKQIQCELCKTPFPSAVESNGNRIAIVKVPTVSPPFIILENNVGNSNKGLHVCSMAEKKDLKLGRGHESDVRIPDVSISRYHATVRFSNGQFLLEDHNSKFGTLVFLRKSYSLDVGDSSSLQVGRTVLNVEPILVREPLIQDVMEITDTAVCQDHPGGTGTPGGAPRATGVDGRLQPSMSLPPHQRRGGDMQSDSAVSGGSFSVPGGVAHGVAFGGASPLGAYEPFVEFSSQILPFGHRIQNASRPIPSHIMGVQMANQQPSPVHQPVSFPVLGVAQQTEPPGSFPNSSFVFHAVNRMPPQTLTLFNPHQKPIRSNENEQKSPTQDHQQSEVGRHYPACTTPPIYSPQAEVSPASLVGRFGAQQTNQVFISSNSGLNRMVQAGPGPERATPLHLDGYPLGMHDGSVSHQRRDGVNNPLGYFARHNTHDLEQPHPPAADDQRWSSCHST